MAVLASVFTWFGLIVTEETGLQYESSMYNSVFTTVMIWTMVLFVHMARKSDQVARKSTLALDHCSKQFDEKVSELKLKNEKLRKSHVALNNVLYELHETRLKLQSEIEIRKAAQAKAIENEARYRGENNNAGLGIALVDENNKIFMVNKHICGILGFSESEFKLAPLDHFIHTDEQIYNQQEVIECTGVGLTLVKRIIEKDNCMIKAKGEVNVGSTFEIHLPLIQE